MAQISFAQSRNFENSLFLSWAVLIIWGKIPDDHIDYVVEWIS